MTATRVLNPTVLSEICMVRSFSSLPSDRNLRRIQRNLFGVANPVETNKIFAEEMEKHQEKAINKWGFDFRSGSPLNQHAQYVWERVSFKESVYTPDMYTLTRAAHVRPIPTETTPLDLLLDERAERENYVLNAFTSSETEDTDSSDDSHDEMKPVVFKMPKSLSATESRTEENSTRNFHIRKRQPKITEYMKERKRLAQTPKKVSPSKRMRMSPGHSASNSHGTPSTYASSISSHFLFRSHQRNH